MKIERGTFEQVPMHIKPDDLVLDVGGGLRPLNRADSVIDFLAWDQRAQADPYHKDIWPAPHFSRDTWVQWDLCSHEPWPFKDKQFDFVVCKQTLEDLRDPVWVCREMMRVAKRGYIETPSRVVETMPGIERSRYCGYSHHHWLCELTDGGIEFLFKHAQLHAYSRFHLTVGPTWNRMRRDHRWSEALDGLERMFTVINRWFKEFNPKYQAVGFFWTDSFECRERVLIDKGDVEADLMAFKEKCQDIPDLWVWKRTWYGKRIRR
jgi:hypothetical protein